MAEIVKFMHQFEQCCPEPKHIDVAKTEKKQANIFSYQPSNSTIAMTGETVKDSFMIFLISSKYIANHNDLLYGNLS